MNGKVVIKFNKKMNTSLNTSWINQTNTLIYVEPQDKKDSEIGFNKSSLDITWFVDSYQDDMMKINIKFSNP